MLRLTLAVLVVVLLLATSVPAEQDGEVRHSGKVVEIADAGRTIVLEEMLAWHDRDQPGVVHRPISLTRQTAIDLVERTEQWGEARTSMPGWKSTAIDASDIRVGDFVTVTTAGRARSRAVALQVIRPGA